MQRKRRSNALDAADQAADQQGRRAQKGYTIPISLKKCAYQKDIKMPGITEQQPKTVQLHEFGNTLFVPPLHIYPSYLVNRGCFPKNDTTPENVEAARKFAPVSELCK